MKPTTRFGLVRHGITAWNEEKRAQGHTNNELNEQGLRQAELVARRLSQARWDYVYSSDLRRARQTAETIASALGIDEISYDERLRELHGGRIEGTTLDERIAAWGEGWRELELGTEGAEAGAARGAACLQELADRHAGANVLVISHGAVLRHTLKRLVEGIDAEQLLGNTSVTELIRDTEGWRCSLYNCTAHLSDAPEC
ncbi:histidine phosphatase family protein [Cohnella fermenti]|uniref:Histidine phosphatase family protein n=1 Tax=Cohnella fermenti TaxID=2565925 RepID=A0A4S4BKP0_9BACL|nr:histidine phosphatase family protein [Cohnella fermenti]THF72715.1 histidine phosphatase family protein [Cohnella fermenti]